MYCNNCRNFYSPGLNARPHVCPPLWEGHLVETEKWADHIPFYFEVPARDGADAAEKFGEQSDQSGDYHLSQSEDHYEDWRVRLKGDLGPGKVYRVSAEQHVSYNAEELYDEENAEAA